GGGGAGEEQQGGVGWMADRGECRDQLAARVRSDRVALVGAVERQPRDGPGIIDEDRGVLGHGRGVARRSLTRGLARAYAFAMVRGALVALALLGAVASARPAAADPNDLVMSRLATRITDDTRRVLSVLAIGRASG